MRSPGLWESREVLGRLSCPGPTIIHIPQMSAGKSGGNEEGQALEGCEEEGGGGTHRGAVTTNILPFDQA